MLAAWRQPHLAAATPAPLHCTTAPMHQCTALHSHTAPRHCTIPHHCTAPPHCTAPLHCITALHHRTALHYTALHCAALHRTAAPLHCTTALHHHTAATLHCTTPLHYTTPHRNTHLHCTARHSPRGAQPRTIDPQPHEQLQHMRDTTRDSQSHSPTRRAATASARRTHQPNTRCTAAHTPRALAAPTHQPTHTPLGRTYSTLVL